jgi:hypothetical protein
MTEKAVPVLRCGAGGRTLCGLSEDTFIERKPEGPVKTSRGALATLEHWQFSSGCLTALSVGECAPSAALTATLVAMAPTAGTEISLSNDSDAQLTVSSCVVVTDVTESSLISQY